MHHLFVTASNVLLWKDWIIKKKKKSSCAILLLWKLPWKQDSKLSSAHPLGLCLQHCWLGNYETPALKVRGTASGLGILVSIMRPKNTQGNVTNYWRASLHFSLMLLQIPTLRTMCKEYFVYFWRHAQKMFIIFFIQIYTHPCTSA